MHKRWIRIAAVLAIVSLPVVGYLLYERLTALPREFTVATGSKDGMYRQLGEDLARQFSGDRQGVTVHVRHTTGSLENLLLLAE